MTAVQVCSLLFCRDPACTACCVPHLLSPTYVGPLRRLSARYMWTCTPCLRYARRASPAGGPPRDLAQDRAHDRAGDRRRPPRGAFLLECMYRRECCPSLAGTFCRGGAVSPAVTSSAVGAGAQQQAGRACTASCQLYKKVTGCSLTVPNLFGRRGSAWSSTMPRELSPAQWDAAFDTLVEQGFVIIPSYFEGEQLEAMAAAMRRVLPTWEEVSKNPPENFSGTMTCDWPYSELILNKTGAQQKELVDFAKRWLGTQEIQIRVGIGLARYPGFKGKQQGVHVGTLTPIHCRKCTVCSQAPK